ncbi:MAG TPA: thioredoxin-disulfide reductase [Nitrospirae bacterium]|nr:thioredoxin-disulfide reductase [Nitrospirota bacterium]
MFDIVIIGGGPAGLTAGLYASRARLKCLLIEKGLMGGQVATTELIENYPGFEQGITGAELSSKMEEQAKKFGLETVQTYVESISIRDKIKTITIEGGGEYEVKSVILGTGAKPTRLGVKGEGKFRGKGVSYCATCDGAFFKGESIAVVGGGNSGVEEAVFLTKFAEKVYVIHRRDKLRADKIAQERAFSNNKVEFKWDTVIEEITGENEVKALHLKNVKTQERSVLNVTGLFIYIGYNPNTGFIKDIVKLDENNYIITDFDMATSVPGIFAAGDVVSGSVKQISVAVGQGTTAAISAGKYIDENFA